MPLCVVEVLDLLLFEVLLEAESSRLLLLFQLERTMFFYFVARSCRLVTIFWTARQRAIFWSSLSSSLWKPSRIISSKTVFCSTCIRRSVSFFLMFSSHLVCCFSPLSFVNRKLTTICVSALSHSSTRSRRAVLASTPHCVHSSTMVTKCACTLPRAVLAQSRTQASSLAFFF